MRDRIIRGVLIFASAIGTVANVAEGDAWAALWGVLLGLNVATAMWGADR